MANGFGLYALGGTRGAICVLRGFADWGGGGVGGESFEGWILLIFWVFFDNLKA